LWLRGTLLRRKVLSQSLAFGTLKVEDHALTTGAWQAGAPSAVNVCEVQNSRATSSSAPLCTEGDVGQVSGVTAALCFMGDIVDAIGSSAFVEGDENVQSDTTWAAFPKRRGDLFVGVRLECVVLLPPPGCQREMLVRRWKRLPDEGGTQSSVARDLAKYHAARDGVNRAARKELAKTRQKLALCKFWAGGSEGATRCQDDACSFRHDYLDDDERKRALDQEAAKRRFKEVAEKERMVYEDDGDGVHGDESRASKSQRASRFAAWMVQQYGRENLSEGTGVLDVAGGQGDLSWALHMDHDVQCTLIDPGIRRGGLLRSWQRRALRKSGKEAFAHLAVEFGVAEFGNGVGGTQQIEVGHVDAVASTPQRRRRVSQAPHAALLQTASLVVGLHPDQATEAIVDLALANGRKFAVVPCCVFPGLFPGRTLEGQEVRTVTQFCAYLKSKDARIEEAMLDFEGRNKVLFIP